jgi:hypothetical protein
MTASPASSTRECWPRSAATATTPPRAACWPRRELNPHIPTYLTGSKKPPEQRPDYVGFGEETEAVDYAAGAGELWASVPGALACLQS